MILEGTIAELIIKLEPKVYRKYVWHDKKGKPMLYVQLKKALYVTLKAALLFWELLSNTLTGWGFKINPYNHCIANCIANKIVNGKQCTIIWHVEDLKISHVDKEVVENVIENLEKKFGKESLLVTARGKVLEYLGMTLHYRLKGKVKMSMYDYVKKIIEEALDDMTGTAKTSAAGHLFTTNKNGEKLSEKKAQGFHHIVAKLLYLCRRTRQDIQMAVA